jgi:hypothetical protein
MHFFSVSSRVFGQGGCFFAMLDGYTLADLGKTPRGKSLAGYLQIAK